MASSWSTLLLVLSVLCVAGAEVHVFGIRGSGLHGDATSAPDPYVKVYCGSNFGGQTDFQQNQPNPSWNVDFTLRECRVGEALKLEVMDKDLMFDDHLGNCITTVRTGTSVPVSCTLPRGRLEFYYDYVN